MRSKVTTILAVVALVFGSHLLMAQIIGTSGLPTGSIVLSDGACPPGLTENTAARGRFMVGVPSGGTVAGTLGTAMADLSDATYTPAGTNGGSGSTNLAGGAVNLGAVTVSTTNLAGGAINLGAVTVATTNLAGGSVNLGAVTVSTTNLAGVAHQHQTALLSDTGQTNYGGANVFGVTASTTPDGFTFNAGAQDANIDDRTLGQSVTVDPDGGGHGHGTLDPDGGGHTHNPDGAGHGHGTLDPDGGGHTHNPDGAGHGHGTLDPDAGGHTHDPDGGGHTHGAATFTGTGDATHRSVNTPYIQMRLCEK